jgi:hypothetical protein
MVFTMTHLTTHDPFAKYQEILFEGSDAAKEPADLVSFGSRMAKEWSIILLNQRIEIWQFSAYTR